MLSVGFSFYTAVWACDAALLAMRAMQLTIWTEYRAGAGLSEAYVLSAAPAGSRGRGARVASRNRMGQIEALKAKMEAANLATLVEVKEFAKKARQLKDILYHIYIYAYIYI